MPRLLGLLLVLLRCQDTFAPIHFYPPPLMPGACMYTYESERDAERPGGCQLHVSCPCLVCVRAGPSSSTCSGELRPRPRLERRDDGEALMCGGPRCVWG